MIDRLNHPNQEQRLEALQSLMNQIHQGEREAPETGESVNNHIHTTYSFSPYSPTMAVWKAYNAGLATAGIMDHDSISGAEEFIRAGEIVGIATTIGVECRVKAEDTPLMGRVINNPDQYSVMYAALHGIPHTQIQRVKDFFAPLSRCRNMRNRLMVDKINEIVPSGIALKFERDVIPISRFAGGGSITERHLMFALARRIIRKSGRGEGVGRFLKEHLGIVPQGSAAKNLADADNPYYEYDLLGLLKSSLIPRVFVPADYECPTLREFIRFGNEIGAITAYPYLGDVGDSVTGDKRPQKFEDDYLDLLFETLVQTGFNAVTYMPARNTMEQLMRVKELCRRHNLFEICGEDINSPRQEFVCAALELPEFQNLIDSAWALIGHEKAATNKITTGMFSAYARNKYPDLQTRIEIFKEIGRG